MRICTRYIWILLLSVGLGSSQSLLAQLTINEVSSDNDSLLIDEDGDYSDWVELYNASDQDLSLGGYSLSDDPTAPRKWIFPDRQILAKGWILIFASDKDKSNAELHTNFKLSKRGEPLSLYDRNGDLVDFIDLPQLGTDQAYGRQPDGADNWAYFSLPSPNASNNNNPTYEFATAPSFENEKTFHNGPITVELRCSDPGCEIRYTLDGNLPDENAALYSGALTLDTTAVVRMAAFAPGLRPSEVKTRHYFVDEQHSLPVIGITTAPANLWDWETGIFQLGPDADPDYPFYGANFWGDREIPIHFEYFVDEQLAIEYPLGARTHGGRGARTKPLKPLRLIAEREFGTTEMQYPFFEDSPVDRFQRLILRNASGDYARTYMRDAFLHRYFIREGLHLDAQSAQPVILYINGVYWGVLYLRERHDERYLHYKFGVNEDSIDLLEKEDLAIEGDFMAFDSMQAFVTNNDLSDDALYRTAASYFDTENLGDYVIVQTIVNNFDWPTNNIKYWRERSSDGKWRYLLFDMDVAMARHGWTTAEADGFGRKIAKDSLRMVDVLLNLLDNEGYRHYFINRYADLLNSTFRMEQFQEEIIRSREELAPEMQRHFDRWGGEYDRWYNEYMDELLVFSERRPDFARQYLMDYFELEKEVLIELDVAPKEAGRISISTLQPEAFPWTGYYFDGVPVPLTAEAAPEYRFSHWETADGARLEEATIEQNFENSTKITAVFSKLDLGEQQMLLSPNPVQRFLILSYQTERAEAASIRVFDAQGRDIGEILPLGVKDPDILHRQEIYVEDLPAGVYFVELSRGEEKTVKRFVKHD